MALNGDQLRALRILSLHGADERTYEAWYKSICRWYSKEFHTPLSQVMEMSEEEVVQVYFDDRYWTMAGSDSEDTQKAYKELKDKILKEGLKPMEKVAAEEEAVEEEEDDWYKEELRKLQEEDEKTDKSDQPKIADKKPNLIGDKPDPETVYFEGEDGPLKDD